MGRGLEDGSSHFVQVEVRHAVVGPANLRKERKERNLNGPGVVGRSGNSLSGAGGILGVLQRWRDSAQFIEIAESANQHSNGESNPSDFRGRNMHMHTCTHRYSTDMTCNSVQDQPAQPMYPDPTFFGG